MHRSVMGIDPSYLSTPRWQGRPGRRFGWSLLLATLVIAGALSLVPPFEHARPSAELSVNLRTPETREPMPPVPETVPHERPRRAVPAASEVEPEPTAEPTPVAHEKRGEAVDWYALLPDAAEAALDATGDTVAINPGFEERRRRAALQFRPSAAPRDRPVWEHVEKDNMGRTLLVSGDCYRVIDDPNVGNRDAFLTFGQYMASCTRSDRAPRQLAFVDEIRNRRADRARSVPPAAE